MIKDPMLPVEYAGSDSFLKEVEYVSTPDLQMFPSLAGLLLTRCVYYKYKMKCNRKIQWESFIGCTLIYDLKLQFIVVNYSIYSFEYYSTLPYFYFSYYTQYNLNDNNNKIKIYS